MISALLIFPQFKSSLSTYRNRIVTAAQKALALDFQLRRLITESERAEHVQYLLGPAGQDLLSMERPFLWGSSDAGGRGSGGPADAPAEAVCFLLRLLIVSLYIL